MYFQYIFFKVWKKIPKHVVPRSRILLLLRNDCFSCHKSLNYSGRFPNGNSLENIVLHPSILIVSFFMVERILRAFCNP